MAASPLVPNAIGESKYIAISNVESAITAKAGGGQSTAYQLTAQLSVVNTVASVNDSVKLPKIVPSPGVLGAVGSLLFLTNNAATNALKAYGYTPDTINDVATGTGNAISAGASVLIFAQDYTTSTGVGRWRMINTTSSAVAAITSGTIAGVTIDNSVIGGGTAAAGTFTALAATDITGTDASLGIAGLAAAQGGAVALVGGTSSTSGNAGGAITAVGGTPGVTGVGGAISLTGGVGGASSGTGGAASVTGGAATAGNSAGGAASLVGGAGSGNLAGGAITITSGAAGATGVAGAVNISVGAATAGNGSAVTITGGNGAGGTASGGNINLVPGTAVSTGVPGEVLVNGVAGINEVTYTSPLMTTAVPATGTAQPFYIATRAMRVKKAYCSVVTHGTSETIAITKDTSGAAPGAGTNVLAAVMTPAASNTPVTQNASSTIATCTLAAGDRLSFLTGGTIGSAAGLTITVLLVPA